VPQLESKPERFPVGLQSSVWRLFCDGMNSGDQACFGRAAVIYDPDDLV